MKSAPAVNRYYDPIAPTRNVALFSVLLQRLVDMPLTRDRMGAFYGDPGLGKSKAAGFVAGEYRAFSITCGLLTTARSMLSDILMDLGAREIKGNNIDLLNQAIYLLAMEPQRPLIVDEAHYVADRRFIDVLRQIHDTARTPIVLIGEAPLRGKLERFPMVRSRIGQMITEALRSNADDIKLMAAEHYPQLAVSEAAVELLLQKSKGEARNIVSRLGNINERAKLTGRNFVDASDVEDLDEAA